MPRADGIGGHLIDLETGDRVWTTKRLHELAERLLPAAISLGCDRELLGIGRLVLDGGGAARQRGIVRRRGIDALLPALAEHTRSRIADETESSLLGAVLAGRRLS